MSDRTSQRAALAATLISSEESYRDKLQWAHYVDWCVVNKREPLVPDRVDGERQVLAFLHTSRSSRGWGPRNVRGHIMTIRSTFKREGYPDPIGSKVSGWFRACVRENGGERVFARIDAITPDQIALAANNRPSETPAYVARIRGIISVAEVFGGSAFDTAFADLPSFAIRRRSDGIVLEMPEYGGRRVLDANTQTLFHHGLSTALAAGAGRDLPLQAPVGQLPSVEDATVLLEAWQRAFADCSDIDVIRGAAALASPEQRAWWAMNVDPNLPTRILDRAYLLVGILGGHRHATMVRLTVGHVTATRTGFTYEVAPHEDKGGLLAGRNGATVSGLCRNVDHLEDDEGNCPVWCPACSLRDLLEMRRHHGATSDSPLWIMTNDAAQMRREVSPTSNHYVERLRLMLGDHIMEDQWIGTRSLRVTSATLAHLNGMSVAQVSEHLGHYYSGSAQAYLRRMDPLGFDLVLNVARPS